jgi:hypothetical protein
VPGDLEHVLDALREDLVLPPVVLARVAGEPNVGPADLTLEVARYLVDCPRRTRVDDLDQVTGAVEDEGLDPVMDDADAPRIALRRGGFEEGPVGGAIEVTGGNPAGEALDLLGEKASVAALVDELNR